jgi:RNA polymerase sigma-70 factor (ECF subfamily)
LWNVPGGGGVPRPWEPPPDQRALSDGEAFARYVLPEVDVLLRVALSRTRNAADAEDLVQDTLLRAYRAIRRFDGSYPRALLLTILRNAQANRVRRHRPSLLRNPDAGPSLHEGQDAQPSAESVVVGRAFDATVEDSVARLPTRFRHVVELIDIEGLSYQVAADALGVPVGTVTSRLHRARHRIRTRLTAAGLVPLSPRRRRTVVDRPFTCREVGKLLQRYFDGYADEHATAKVAEHLEDCRRCGLDSGIYREIKASLARQATALPETTLVRLRRFGQQLATHGPPDAPADDGDRSDPS